MTRASPYTLLIASVVGMSCASAATRTSTGPVITPASAQAPCPDGGSWVGLAPPYGDGYHCAVQDSAGQWLKHGWAVAYNDAGVKVEECQYDRGKLDGRCTLFHDDGSKKARGVYESGERVGEWATWPSPEERQAAIEAEQQREEAARRVEKRADDEARQKDVEAKLNQVSDQEAAEGRCNETRFAELQQSASWAEEAQSRHMSVIDQKIVVLKDGETEKLTFKSLLAGRYLVYVWSYSPLDFVVTDDDGNRFTDASRIPLGNPQPVRGGIHLSLGQLQPVNVALSGRGCTLLMVLREF